MHLHPNTLLQGGKYKIVRFINAGGFGNTYEGLDVNLNKRVAIKEFFVKDFCGRDAATTAVTVTNNNKEALFLHLKERFWKEAQAIAQMEHENIVNVQALFEENGTAYYVMDFIDGESVGALLKRRGSLPESKALPIIRKVASALDYMHKQNRLHLDVKPGNIMLRKKDGKVVLIDFGSSKQYAEAGGENTTTLAPCYTKGYAPSEQMNPEHVKFTAATDVYALGATLYKMLTGQTPPSAIMLLNDEEQLPPLPPEVSAGVKECVQKAMIPQRSKRLQSIEEFLAVMDNCEDTVSEDTVCEDEEQRRREEETRRHEEKRKREEAARKAAEEAKRKAEEERKKKAQSGNGGVWKVWAGVTTVILIAAIGIGIANRGGDASVTDGDSPAINETSRISYDTSTNTISFPGGSYKMVLVEDGTFSMGSNDSEAWDAEKPVHEVTLSSYHIGETEVTQALWQAVMGNNPSEFKGKGNPVENVSWDDCQEFVRKLNSLTGQTFRLPTEAEWEFAARGGRNSEGYRYSGSNNLGSVAWYYDNSNSKTHPVKSKQPNELGIYDMGGNVWEWCQDWYGEYSSSDQTNPHGPSSGSRRVIRGGSWDGNARYCRSSFRDDCGPAYRGDDLGLRLAL